MTKCSALDASLYWKSLQICHWFIDLSFVSSIKYRIDIDFNSVKYTHTSCKMLYGPLLSADVEAICKSIQDSCPYSFERILSPTKYAQISVLGFQRKEKIIAPVRKVMKFLAQCFSGLYILKIRTSWLDSLSSICRWLHEASLVALKSNLYCISNVKISTKRIFLGVKRLCPD